MAQAMENKSGSDLNFLTDCMYFINGRCKLDNNCRFRHCREAAEQINNCSKWPKKCRNVTCPYRHPIIAFKKKTPIPEVLPNHLCQPQPPALQQEGLISFFWDIENVPIPKGQKPFDIVQRIRQKLVVEPGLQEADFSCYCNSNTISQENQESLHHAAVRIVHVPDRKPNAVDRQIMLDLDRFERIHRPPATIVLISGDIDFVGKLSDLRHQARFHVIVIHNKPAKEELKATVNEHYSWELFTQQQQPIPVVKGLDPVESKQILQRPQQHRLRDLNSGNIVRRRNPSQSRRFLSDRQQVTVDDHDVKKHRCPICTSEFESIQSLRQHQSVKDHLFHCPVCNENFVIIESQIQHQKDKNHYVKDYKCNQCNRYFAKIESLNQHQQATGHISSVIQPSSVPLSSYDSKQNAEDYLAIILNGIEAIKQHYMKTTFKK
jgi:hypothetical protein